MGFLPCTHSKPPTSGGDNGRPQNLSYFLPIDKLGFLSSESDDDATTSKVRTSRLGGEIQITGGHIQSLSVRPEEAVSQSALRLGKSSDKINIYS